MANPGLNEDTTMTLFPPESLLQAGPHPFFAQTDSELWATFTKQSLLLALLTAIMNENNHLELSLMEVIGEKARWNLAGSNMGLPDVRVLEAALALFMQNTEILATMRFKNGSHFTMSYPKRLYWKTTSKATKLNTENETKSNTIGAEPKEDTAEPEEDTKIQIP